MSQSGNDTLQLYDIHSQASPNLAEVSLLSHVLTNGNNRHFPTQAHSVQICQNKLFFKKIPILYMCC